MSEQNKARELRALAEADQALTQPQVIATSPARIWLDLGFDPALEELDFQDLHDVTWSEDNATDHGIEYVRADLAANPAAILELIAERDALLAALKRQVEHFDGMEVDEIEEECGLDTAQRVDVARAAIQKAEGSRNEQGA